MFEDWEIRITDRRGRAKVHPLTELPFILGRDESLTPPIDDPQSSRKHCKLEENDDNSFKLIDLNSTNGTFLNGRKTNRGVVTDGDRIKIGETIIELTRRTPAKINEDTGARKLDILKSMSAPSASKSRSSSADDNKENKNALLSRIAAPDGGALSNDSQQRLTFLADMARTLTEETSSVEFHKQFLDGLLRVFPIEKVVMLTPSEVTGQLAPGATRSREGATGGVAVSRTICSHVAKENEVILTEDAVADPRFSSGDSIIENRIGAVIAAPIHCRGSQYGIVYCTTPQMAAQFKDEDLSFLALASNLAGLAILLEKTG